MGWTLSKRVGSGLMLAALAGCGVVGPVVNPSATRAPYFACGYVAPPPEAQQCFTLQRRTLAGEALPMNDGTLEAGEQILAMPTGGPGCAHEYTFATVRGDSDGAGKMSLIVFGVGFGLAHRDFAWAAPVADRTFAVPNIGGAILNPQGAWVRPTEGRFRVSEVCFRAFHGVRGAERDT